MQAVIFGLMMPVIPLLIRKLYKKDEALAPAQIGGRYVVYALLTTLSTSIVMVALCEEGTSFVEKTDQVPMFLLKYVLLEAVAAGVIAAAEWAYTT